MRYWLPRPLFAAVTLLLFAIWTPAAGAEPGDASERRDPLISASWLGGGGPPESVALAEGSALQAAPCSDAARLLAAGGVTDLVVALAEPEAGPTAGRPGFCALRNERSQSYLIWLAGARTAAEFRAAKDAAAPRLAGAGIDPCRIGAWLPASAAVQRATNFNDWHDAGRPCPPSVFAHGPESERRLGEFQVALDQVMAATRALFGWSLTWPLHVHLYDGPQSFRRGVEEEGGLRRGPSDQTKGVTIVSTSRITAIFLDLATFPRADDLLVLTAHEFHHVTQHGMLGCDCLPFFAAEGTAEAFAAFVAGVEQPIMANRFQTARHDQHRDHVTPLERMLRQPSGDASDAYSRGYAAMLYVALSWGWEALPYLYIQTAGGSAAAFTEALGRVTGMTLAEFDRSLGEFLLAQRGFAEPLGPNATLKPDSRLLRISAVALGAGPSGAEIAIFGGSDAGLELRLRWDCIDQPEAVQVEVVMPSGRTFGEFRGTLDRGCIERNVVRLRFDDPISGRAPRAFPGVWRIDVVAWGEVQGSMLFTLE